MLVFKSASSTSSAALSNTGETSMNVSSTVSIIKTAATSDLILLGVKEVADVDKWGKLRKQRLQNRLLAFASVGARVLPACLVNAESVVFLDNISSRLLRALHEEGKTIFFARREMDDQGKSSLIGAAKEKQGIKLAAWEGQKSLEVDENSLSTLMVEHFISITNALSIEQLKTFLTLFLGSKEEEGNKVSIIPTDGDEKLYSKILVDLDTRIVTTNRDFAPIRNKSFINPIGLVSGKANLALLILYIAGNSGRAIKDINGILAFLTQVWEEEDTYGMKMTSSQRLRHVRHNSAAVMKLQPSDSVPFFSLSNFNTVEGIAWAARVCSNAGIPYFLDKYGSKRIVVGPGINALFLGAKYDKNGQANALRFITDMKKEKKMPNRPWNATAIVANEGLAGTPGHRPYTVSKMRIKSQDDNEQELLLEDLGDKRWTVFTNQLFAVNGSGVGDVGPIPFSYSLDKCVRGTLNSINLKDGVDLEMAAEEIKTDLLNILREGRVLKSEDNAGFREVYSYNGIPLLTFSGFNQDLILNEDCEVSVKHTPTSESLLVSMTAKLAGSFHEIKFRGLGIKAVLKQTGKEIVDSQNNPVDYEVHMAIECQKGFAWVLPMFCEAMCDQTKEEFCVLDVDAGTITVPHKGLVVDLASKESALTDWIKANTQTYTTTDYVCRDEFEYLMTLQDFSEVITWEVDAEDDDLIIVHEKCVGIAGWFTGNVEVSTRPENSSVNQTYLTIEQLAGMSIGSSKLANRFA